MRHEAATSIIEEESNLTESELAEVTGGIIQLPGDLPIDDVPRRNPYDDFLLAF